MRLQLGLCLFAKHYLRIYAFSANSGIKSEEISHERINIVSGKCYSAKNCENNKGFSVKTRVDFFVCPIKQQHHTLLNSLLKYRVNSTAFKQSFSTRVYLSDSTVDAQKASIMAFPHNPYFQPDGENTKLYGKFLTVESLCSNRT